jgi:predicted  nucleic acid-binding Zn-ribbon protein
MSNFEQAIKDLQDALIVIAEIEKRQSTLLREHSERIVRLEAESLEFRRRTDQNLAKITDKLNGLIGYVGGMNPPPSQ